jgi:sugar phosphate isomerase/epimerase
MPCHHGFLLSPPEFRELIDRVNSPVVGAALDWSTCAGFGDPADWIATLQHRLAALSIDAVAPTWNGTLLPALRDAGFDGMLIHTGAAGNTG